MATEHYLNQIDEDLPCHTDGLAQDCSISSALEMGVLQSFHYRYAATGPQRDKLLQTKNYIAIQTS